LDELARQDFTEFVAARSPELIRLAYVLTGDQHAAEDLLQSALTKAAAHWGRINSTPDGYVRRIMYRAQIDGWRRRSRRPETAMAQVPEPPAEDPAISQEARLALQVALRALRPVSAPSWCCAISRTCPSRRWRRSWAVRSGLCAARRTRRSAS